MNHGSLFSGIGGFDLAAQWMGWNNIFHCEKDSFCRKVLTHYWPQSISHADITETDFTVYRGQLDILTGGFPCQPFSTAGKQEGTEDDRHLWPEMLRCIREVRPVYVVGENVRGILDWNEGLVFDMVQSDLENEGFQVLPFLLPASSVGARHSRNRMWFVAYSKGNRDERPQYCCNEEVQGKFRGMDCADPLGAFRKGGRGAALVESPILSRHDGLSTRLDRITLPEWQHESSKAYGNAIVPQVAYQIFQSLATTSGHWP